jgi:hypothetical protein
MKDGVDYVLRFGDPVTGSTGSLNRFLFVMAEFDESQFPMPEKPAGREASDTPAETPDAGNDASATEPAGDSDAANVDPTGGEQATDADAGAAQSGGCQEEAPQDQNADADTAEQDTVEQDTAEQDAAGDAEAASDVNAASIEIDSQSGEQPANEGAESEQQMLEKEYQRKLDEREENIKKGKKRAAELNARFADWYYVISEDIYKKVHLGRADIIKSAGADENAGVGAFRELEEQGLSTN